jgi:molecular chaperone GrpE
MKKKSKEKPKSEDSQEAENKESAKNKESEELRNTIENLQKEKGELFEKLQRVSADYANFQKRVPKQIADNVAYEKEMIIKSLLPALDNFEHTLQNKHSVENPDALVKGIKIIYDQMLDILKSYGVEQIQALGENFNPSMHEAVMQMTEPQKQDNIILQEFQKGYKLNGRVIRPGKVVVNKLATGQAIQEQDETDLQQQIDEENFDEFETTDSEEF